MYKAQYTLLSIYLYRVVDDANGVTFPTVTFYISFLDLISRVKQNGCSFHSKHRTTPEPSI